MRRAAVAVFLVLHGLVHLWYVVLSRGWIEVEDAMGWRGQSWLLSGVLPRETILLGASVAYVAVAVGFVAGAAGYYRGLDWWPSLLVGAAVLSTVTILALWQDGLEKVVEKGGVGVLINAAILAWLLAFE